MNDSATTQAIMLLTQSFPHSGSDSVKPLTPTEWKRLVKLLLQRDRRPGDFLSESPSVILNGWSDRSITIQRVEALLGRGLALALCMDRWSSAGILVLTRADADYPKRLKQRLGWKSPPVLYCCGHLPLLNNGGLAVVGSRNASEEDLRYAKELGSVAAQQGHNVVSGGARGVDDAAMTGALEAEGCVIGALGNSLLRRCASRKYRRHLLESNLILFSSAQPEARFFGWRAMQRNAYIYCLSDAAVVVHSGRKGGTWQGAIDHFKLDERGVPVWVKPTDNESAGNAELVARKAHWTEKEASRITVGDLFAGFQPSTSTPPQPESSAISQPEPEKGREADLFD